MGVPPAPHESCWKSLFGSVSRYSNGLHVRHDTWYKQGAEKTIHAGKWIHVKGVKGVMRGGTVAGLG